MTLKRHPHAERSKTSSSLLYELKGDNSDAWVRLIDTYSLSVYQRCRHSGLCVEDAEDLAQEVFLAISRSFERYQPLTGSASFRKWLGTITTNKLRDYWRKHQALPLATGGTTWHKLVQSFEDKLADGSISTVHAVREPDGLWKEIVYALRAEVSLRDWRIFEHVVLEEKAPADVAKEFRVTINVVYLAQSRLLRRIRELLDTDTSHVPPKLRME